jgi:Phage major capsid protein E
MARFLSPYELNEIESTILVDRDYPLPTELQSNFSTLKLFGTETLNLDKIAPDLRIGIFVAPDVQAKASTLRGYQTKVFYPGYWKDKFTPDFRNIRTRRVGEQISVPTSNSGRLALAIQDGMTLMQNKKARLIEWISSQILLYGSYVATSELHPDVLVDLEPNVATHLTLDAQAAGGVPASQAVSLAGGRANRANISGTVVNLPTGQTIASLGTNRNWGGASATPVEDLQAMLNASWENVSKIYMSDDAFAKLAADPLFAKIVTPFMTAMSVANLDLLPKQQTMEGLKFRGSIGTQNIPIWTYSAQYQPTNSTSLASFIGAGWVVCVPNSAYGVQAYGAVQHGLADFQPQEIFWNSWTEDEMGQPWVQAQAAPLLLHTKINSTVAWKVM